MAKINNDLIMDLKVLVTVELGNKKMLISEFLKTNHGTVLELDKESKEALTFYVNDRPFGLCEIVKMPNDKLGMRVLKVFPSTLPEPV